MSRIIEKLNRNRCTECGPIFCVKCGEFFDDHRKTNVANYASCSCHKGKEGYSLLEKLRKMDRVGV